MARPRAIDPTVPLDSWVHTLGIFTGPRSPGGGPPPSGGRPGAIRAFSAFSTQQIVAIDRFENPATAAVAFPQYFFGADASGANNDGQVVAADDAGYVLWTLCHADSPWAGDDPWLCVLDLWVAWVRARQHKSTADNAQASAIALIEDDENNTSFSINGGAYGAKLVITGGGSQAGDPAGLVRDLVLFAGNTKLNDPDWQLQQRGLNPGIGPPDDEDWHRWTIVARTRDALGNPGFARFFYDERLVWDVPKAVLPKAAMIFSGFVATGPNAVGGEERGFRLANVQAYHTRDLTFLPWRPPVQVELVRTKAGLVFRDQFNRADSNTVGNGWTEQETNASDCQILSNKLRIDSFTTNANHVFRSLADHPDDYIESALYTVLQANTNVGLRSRTTGITGPIIDGSDNYLLAQAVSLANVRVFKRKNNTNTLLGSAALTQAVNDIFEMRMVNQPDGANRRVRAYGRKLPATTLTLHVDVTDTDPPPFGTQVQMHLAFNRADWDDFFICGRVLTVRGLREGWQVQIDNGTPVVAGATGEVGIDMAAERLPGGALIVLDENGNRIGGIWPEGFVWGGDEYEVR